MAIKSVDYFKRYFMPMVVPYRHGLVNINSSLTLYIDPCDAGACRVYADYGICPVCSGTSHLIQVSGSTEGITCETRACCGCKLSWQYYIHADTIMYKYTVKHEVAGFHLWANDSLRPSPCR